jgi:hypothetical protein
MAPTKIYTPIALAPLILLYTLTLQAPFFWDTTHLASEQAHWFVEKGLNAILLPDSLDSGHPPLTGWLLALVWKFAGKGLLQSHLMMLPFLTIAVWNLLLLIRFYFPDEAHLIQFWLLLNPFFLAQSMLVSPDIILLSGFFLTLHGIVSQQKWKILTGSLILCLVSMRGMTCVAVLALFSIIRTWQGHRSYWGKISPLLLFLPAGLAGGLFLLVHFKSKGWIGYHPGSPWAPSFEKVSIVGFSRNILILLWRLADQGLLFLWIPPAFFILKSMLQRTARHLTRPSARTTEIGILVALLFTIGVFPQLFFKQLLMHRYLLPLTLILTILAASILIDSHANIKKLVPILSVLLISGYCWIYPDRLSKGWDAMPLHYPFYNHREDMLLKMQALNIEPGETGAAFPYDIRSKIMDITDDDRKFAPLDLQQNKYILFSNISNDFDADMMNTLEQNWIKIASTGTWPIRFILYQNPHLLNRSVR